MKQLIIRRMTALDLFLNIFYRARFQIVNKLFPWKLRVATPARKEGYKLTFEDDFEEISWDIKKGKKWKVAQGWGQFHPDFPHQYDGAPELINGTSCARFYVIYDPKEFPDDLRTGNPITISHRRSLISTTDSFRQQYGRFEIRCNIPFERGAWPAFWMWGITYPPEIDIFELYGGEDGSGAGVQKINLHYGNVKEGTKTDMRAWGIKIAKNDVVRHFHEFVMEWSEDKIEMFTDGLKVFRYTNKEVLQKWYNVPQANMHLVLNHAIQPEFVPAHDKDFYTEFLVDYVRVYKKSKITKS